SHSGGAGEGGQGGQQQGWGGVHEPFSYPIGATPEARRLSCVASRNGCPDTAVRLIVADATMNATLSALRAFLRRPSMSNACKVAATGVKLRFRNRLPFLLARSGPPLTALTRTHHAHRSARPARAAGPHAPGRRLFRGRKPQ